jgi:hypothetical protein
LFSVMMVLILFSVQKSHRKSNEIDGDYEDSGRDMLTRTRKNQFINLNGNPILPIYFLGNIILL